ncbi:protein root UVB sensitive 5 [Prunus yedoensis var. nudiflora]|uniref:Protein root UVB sensitive 5 n=1 Tax=Prunus yedoensis var. nudiflora TaxID=2094558 RepID=A0A314YEK5_PRUYE|nr:protein root UVB sensitive 5 [Prunus yedoensis var. nudiflora]
MPCGAVQLSLPTCALESSRKPLNFRHCHFRIACSSPSSVSNLQKGDDDENQADHGRNRGRPHVILVERYGNGTAKRYVVDDELKVQTFIEEERSLVSNNSESSHFSNSTLSWLPDIVKDFIFPAGFPGSVSDDYLLYMLLQFPTNVTAWICHTLVTSSLLKAVGVGSFSGSTAAASAAAIRWVSKDGIGAVGRLFIGGRFGNVFDDDPKQWRLYADFIGSAGSIFDLTTPLYPCLFPAIGISWKSCQGCCERAKRSFKPCDSKSFCSWGKSGGDSSKGGSLGSGCSAAWPGFGHTVPRYTRPCKSISSIGNNMDGHAASASLLNLKRARMLVKSHVLHSIVPGYIDCNREENILLWPRFMTPRITFGVPLEEMIFGERTAPMLKALLELYTKEKYILVVNQQISDFEVFVSFKVGATSISVLRSVWQAYWLYENWNRLGNAFDQLTKSLLEMEDRFEDFIQQLNGSGWDTSQINLKVPREISLDELSPI